MSAFSQGVYQKRSEDQSAHSSGAAAPYDNPGFTPDAGDRPAVYDADLAPKSQHERTTEEMFAGADGAHASGRRKSRLAVLAMLVVVIVIFGVVLAVLLTREPDETDSGKSTKHPASTMLLERKSFTGSAALANQVWQDDLSDAGSTIYNQTAKEFEDQMDQVFTQNPHSTNQYLSTTVLGFQPGSVLVTFRMLFDVEVKRTIATDETGTETTDRELRPINETVVRDIIQRSGVIDPQTTVVIQIDVDVSTVRTTLTTFKTTETSTTSKTTPTTTSTAASIKTSQTTPTTTSTTPATSVSITTTSLGGCDEIAEEQYYVWIPLLNITEEFSDALYSQVVSSLTQSTSGVCSITRIGVIVESSWFLVVGLRFRDGAGETEDSVLDLFKETAELYQIPLFTVLVKSTPPVCEFRCPDTLHCIAMTALCDGFVDCLSSGLDESTLLCRQQATPPSTSPTSRCTNDLFECVGSGRCIVSTWRCDDYADCPDHSDEEGCVCKEDEFTCLNLGCIDQSMRCDGQFDCEDESDEFHCKPTPPPTTECEEGEYKCRNSECISQSKRCDGQVDCDDHTDETFCPSVIVECTEEEFECIKYAECVGASHRCDGQYDCTDYSDEWYGCDHPTQAPWTPTSFEVRLMQNDVDTTQSLIGRVEVRKRDSDDVFGTVCDDMWSDEDAMVVCRMIDTSFSGAAYAYSFAKFGKGAGPILMTNVDCRGDEENIGQCLSRDIIHCTHAEDAGVQCGGTPLQTTPMPTSSSAIRLARGQNCLEGDVQLYHEGEWRFVCDDYFDDRAATVVCRMLGHNAGLGAAGSGDRVGDEKYWLDDVICRGNETDIRDCSTNPLGDHNCGYKEIASVMCAGDPTRECSKQTQPCLENVTCSFDEDSCCYGFPSGASYVKGSSTWVWYNAGQIGGNDVTTGLYTGGVVYYRNVYGDFGDYGSLVLPQLEESSVTRKLEFYYLVQSYGYAALSVVLQTASGIGEVLWMADRVPLYPEGTWGFACIDLSAEVTSASKDVRFVARRGSYDDRVIALDGISLTDGICNSSILTAPCHFDKPYQCGMRILCEDCREGVTEYRWKWSTRDAESQKTTSVVTFPEYFVMADASHGHRGDVAQLQFELPFSEHKEGLEFLYSIPSDDHAALKVLINQGSESYYAWNSRFEERTGNWQYACAHITDSSGKTSILFEAVHGDGPFGDIVIDHVQLVDSCSDESCDIQTGTCQAKVYSSDAEQYTWTKGKSEEKTIRLVNGRTPNEGRVEILHDGDWGTVCDDHWTVKEAEVVCRQLGYRSVVNYYAESHFGEGEGYIWMTDVVCTGSEQKISDCEFTGWDTDICDHTEDAGVECYPHDITEVTTIPRDMHTMQDAGAHIGAWAMLVYPDLKLPDGQIKLTFELKQTTNDVLNIYLTDAEDPHDPLLSAVLTHSAIFERVCTNLPDTMNRPKRLIFEGVKGRVLVPERNWQPGALAVHSVNITSGHCKDTLPDVPCTFEGDYRTCSISVSPADGQTCKSGYQWSRQTGVRNDHTQGDTTGHFMYVDKNVGVGPRLSTITFKRFEMDKDVAYMHVRLHFLKEDTMEPSTELNLNVNDKNLVLENRITGINSWTPVCVSLSTDTSATVNVLVTAVDINAAIDDVITGGGACIDFSVNCDFQGAFVCGYILEAGWQTMENDTDAFLRSPSSPAKLVSPPIELTGSEACLTITTRTTKNHSPTTATRMKIELVKLPSGESVLYDTTLIPVYQSEWMEVSVKIPGLSGKYAVVFSTESGPDDTAFIDISAVALSDGSCSRRDCQGTYHPCGEHFCLPALYVCDGAEDCVDGSDEAECPSSINCTFDKALACGYQLKNSYISGMDVLENLEMDPHVVLKGDSDLALAETPTIVLEDIACLTFTFIRNDNRNMFRVVQNTLSALAQVASFGDLLSQGKQMSPFVTLPAGTYSIIFESQYLGESTTGGDIYMDNVLVHERACDDACAKDMFTCNYTGRDRTSYTVCMTSDVICNGKPECPSGKDEENCPNHFDCDFESTTDPLCEYEIKSPHMTVVKTPYQHPQGFTVTSDDTEESALLYTPTTPGEEASITTGYLMVRSSACTISTRLFFYASSSCESQFAIDVTLHDETQEHTTVQLNSTELVAEQWFTYTVPVTDFLSTGSTGYYKIEMKMISDCAVVAINSISSNSCAETVESGSTTTAPTSTSTTSPAENTNLPENFPEVHISPTTKEIPRLDDVMLTCNVSGGADSQMTYYWYVNGMQMTRGSEILHQTHLPTQTDSGNVKYAVDVTSDTDTAYVLYRLKINRLNYSDTGTYACVVDVWGYNETQRPIDVVYFRVKEREPLLGDDNCYTTSIETCHSLGQRKTTLPGVFGIYDFVHANTLVDGTPIQNQINKEYCEDPLQRLMCALYTPDCHHGNGVAVCREDCEDITHACTTADSLNYGCQFLPYRKDHPSCKRIWVGCGNTLAATNEVQYIRSKNYPEPYSMNTTCSYFVEAEKFQIIKFEIIDFDLGISHPNSPCFLEFYDGDQDNSIAVLPCDSTTNNDVITTSTNRGVVQLVTESESTGRGILLSYEQVPMYSCDIIGVVSAIVVRSADFPEKPTDTDTCTSHLLFAENPLDLLFVEIMALQFGCVRLFELQQNGESSLMETVCIAPYHFDVTGQVLLEFNASAVYYFKATVETYKRGVDQVRLDWKGRVELFSGGAVGSLCNKVNDESAELICRSLGDKYFMSYDETRDVLLPPLVSDIKCTGEEKSIMECHADFDVENNCPWYPNAITLECAPASLACSFGTYTCGYDITGDLTQSYYDGLHLEQRFGAAGKAVSTRFRYTEDAHLHFNYTIRNSMDTLKLHLYNIGTQTSTELWSWQNYHMTGEFTGCVSLPTSEDTSTEYQLVIELASNMIPSETQVSDKHTGIINISIMHATCADTFCTFENPHACETFINLCTEETSMTPISHLLSDTFWTGDWIQYDNTIGEPVFSDDPWHYEPIHKGHYMVIDERDSHARPFLNLANIDPQLRFLRLYYSIQTTTRSENVAMTLLGKSSVVLQLFGDGPGWHGACATLPDDVGEKLYLTFGDEAPGNDKVDSATLFLDDISLSMEPCQNSLACSFENGCAAFFKCPGDCSSSFIWKQIAIDSNFELSPGYDVTFDTVDTGHVLYANLEKATEGDVAITEIDLNHWFPNHVCMNFYYYLNGNGGDAGSLQVNLINSYRSHVIEVANGNNGDLWHATSISVPGDVQRIQLIASKGSDESFISVDDVSISKDNCFDGLQDLKHCSFDFPQFCTANVYSNSKAGYRWTRFVTSNVDMETLEYDADGNNEHGYYMAVEGKYGVEGDITKIDFHVTVDSKQTYQFWYWVSNALELNLSTYHSDGDIYYLPVDVENTWLLSPCFHLPDDFSGLVYIEAERGQDTEPFVAVDNIKLLESARCQEPTLSCDFSQHRNCGFISVSQMWSRDLDRWKTVGSGLLNSPAERIPSGQFCFGFTYSIQRTAKDFPVLSVTYNGESVWLTKGEHHALELRRGQVTLSEGVAHVSFLSSGNGIYHLFDTSLTSGACQPIQECSSGEFSCPDRCIPASKRCDGDIDCVSGEDENMNTCGFKYSTSFTTAKSLAETGYRQLEDSVTDWSLQNSLEIVIDGVTTTLETQMLMTRFKFFTMGKSVVQSPVYYLEEPESCLQVNYATNIGLVAVELSRLDGEDSHRVETKAVASPSVRPILVTVGAGYLQFRLTVGASRENFKFDSSALLDSLDVTFGVTDIIIHPGTQCTTIQIDCPDDIPLTCADNSGCYTSEQRCDMERSCQDNSDESVGCGYGIECDFEQINICGYRNLTVPRLYIDNRGFYFKRQSLWERTASTIISRPLRDHTYKSIGKGHFLSSRNYEGLVDLYRYVDEEIMQSPYQRFHSDGCIQFWYYLNSTGHQPKSTTAQLFVYLQHEDSQSLVLHWFDHVNRQITDWLQGGIPVLANKSVSLVVKAKTSVPYDVYASVVSFDDVRFVEGPCMIDQPVCDQTTFRCSADEVCIPSSFVCDGETDCLDGSDETSCADKPDGALQLIGGDGSYGKLGYFYGHAWRPVCHPESEFEQNKFKIREAYELCGLLGFRGNSDSFGYRFWEKHTDIFINYNCDNVTCSVEPTVDNCEMYTYLRCSNEVCFSGEELCPGTSSTCRPRSQFCDGEMNCPGNGDENQCYCKPGETQCRHIERDCENDACETCEDRNQFECGNHQCIDLARRCDGINDCVDGTDEYKCVQIDKNLEVTIFDGASLSRRQVCVDDVELQVAQHICLHAGKGYLMEILRGPQTIPTGVVVTSSSEGNDFQLHEKRNCFPLRLKCQQPECGTTVVQDSLVETLILNGEDAYIEEWPFYAFLFMDGVFMCGGTLISPGWVVTAIHCFPDLSAHYSVVLGTNERFMTGNWNQTIRVREIIAFDYSSVVGGVPTYDIVLLKLERDALLNDYTRPACLPTQGSLDSAYSKEKETSCYIVGLGVMERMLFHPKTWNVLPKTLQKQRVDLIPREMCSAAWSPYDEIADHVVCASREGPNAPTCFGDSGGPLLCKNDAGRWELFGALSFGLGNCDSDTVPAVFTSILHFKEWIASVTGIEYHG